MPQELALWVQECSCTCGNKWTHSYATYSSGGTPTEKEEQKLPVAYIIPSQRLYHHCFRCAPLVLGFGWQKPQPQPQAQPQPKPKPNLSSLLED